MTSIAGLYSEYRDDFRKNIKLATPIMTGQLGQVIVNVVDSLMVGRLGAASLASVSLAVSICIIFIIVGTGISFALPPLLAKAHGAGQHKRVGIYFYHSTIINIVYAIFSIISIEVIVPLLGHLGHNPEVVQLAIPYIRITAYAMIPLMLFQSFRCFADGLSWTLLPMIAIITGNVANVILNYMFIFGNWGAPMMGVKGAAMSTMIARILMLVVLFGLIYKREALWNHLKIKSLKLKKRVFNNLLEIGIPTSLQMFFEVSGFAGAALLMGILSRDAQAAHQIAINMSAVTFLICSGLGMAATVRVGNRLGEKNAIGIRRAGLSSIVQVVIIMLVFSLIMIIFRAVLPTFYIDDVNVINIASTLLIAAAIFQIPDGIQVVALGALRGLQDVKAPTFITFVAYWVFGLPFSYFSAFYFDIGPIGIWLGLVVGLTISSTLLTLRFWKKSKVSPTLDF
ncbi:MAG: MATE family efflux transporter [Saprospiraceae bacterium]